MPLGVTQIPADVGRFDPFRGQLVDSSATPAKKQRVAGGLKILFDIAKESADWFPPLKSALGGIGALIKHYEVLTKRMSAIRY